MRLLEISLVSHKSGVSGPSLELRELPCLTPQKPLCPSHSHHPGLSLLGPKPFHSECFH